MDLGFEEAAELPFAHVKGGGNSFESQDGAEMLLNEPEDFFCEEDPGVIFGVNREGLCGRVAAEIMPDFEKFGFDEEFIGGKILLIKGMDGIQALPERF